MLLTMETAITKILGIWAIPALGTIACHVWSAPGHHMHLMNFIIDSLHRITNLGYCPPSNYSSHAFSSTLHSCEPPQNHSIHALRIYGSLRKWQLQFFFSMNNLNLYIYKIMICLPGQFQLPVDVNIFVFFLWSHGSCWAQMNINISSSSLFLDTDKQWNIIDFYILTA